MTVVQLIALAGGLVEFADGEKIKIMRTEKGAPVALPFNYKLFSEGKRPGAEHPVEARGHGHRAVMGDTAVRTSVVLSVAMLGMMGLWLGVAR